MNFGMNLRTAELHIEQRTVTGKLYLENTLMANAPSKNSL